MKCCSRSTLGVIIGSLNILFYMGVCVTFLVIMQQNDNSSSSGIHDDNVTIVEGSSINKDQEDTAITMRTIILSAILSSCLLMVIASVLLIVGIVQRRHKLMWPWLALSGLAFACNCIKLLSTVVVGFVNGIGPLTMLIALLINLLAIGIHALILYPIYTLCRDIPEKNKQTPTKIVDSPPQYNYSNFS